MRRFRSKVTRIFTLLECGANLNRSGRIGAVFAWLRQVTPRSHFSRFRVLDSTSRVSRRKFYFENIFIIEHFTRRVRNECYVGGNERHRASERRVRSGGRGENPRWISECKATGRRKNVRMTEPESILARKVIVTCALTGVAATRKQCPAIPYTPAEIGEEARRAYEAGASVVHIHAREDDGSPSHRVEVYGEIMKEVRKRSPVLINFSTGAVEVPKEERVRHITELRPEIGALNMGSMNYAKYNSTKKGFVFNWVFENSFDTIQFFLDAMVKSGVKPELECFDVGHCYNIRPFLDMGLVKGPLQFSFIMGVLGGVPATAKNLAAMAEQIPEGSVWEVIGISHVQWLMIASALALGGNIRVGLEDNFYVAPNVMAKSNGDLVEKAVRMARDTGREPATVEEAKSLLSLAG